MQLTPEQKRRLAFKVSGLIAKIEAEESQERKERPEDFELPRTFKQKQ